MSEQHPEIDTPRDQPGETKPEILRNEIGQAVDPTVVVDEADRTVLLTENETIVIEKEQYIDVPPVNRPRKVYQGMWGPVEVGVLGAGMLAVLGVILLYIFFVVPSNRELESKRAARRSAGCRARVRTGKVGQHFECPGTGRNLDQQRG